MAEKPPLRCQIRADRGWSSAGSFPGTSRLGFEGIYDDEDDRLPRPAAFHTTKVSRSLLSECCLYRIIVAAAFTRINGLPAMYCAMHTHGRSAPSDLSPLKRRLECQPALARRGTPIRYAHLHARDGLGSDVHFLAGARGQHALRDYRSVSHAKLRSSCTHNTPPVRSRSGQHVGSPTRP